MRYLDWLRGVAILAMIESHIADAWVRDSDRASGLFLVAMFVGGLAAPLFLFMAGVGVSLAIHARTLPHAVSKDETGHASAVVRQRGWHILGLALLFRAQAQVLGWGALVNLFKVDILNVIGLAMAAAATLWQMGRGRAGRIALFVLTASSIALATPIVWTGSALAGLPDPLEAYLRPVGVIGQFPLFPWAAFLFAGAAVGELVQSAREGRRPDALHGWLLAAGLTLTIGSWWASSQPALYPGSTFWGSSPTFFGMRLGIVVVLVPAAWAHCAFWLPSEGFVRGPARVLQTWGRLMPSVVADAGRRVTEAVETMGRSSLFVYWVHVELVYGLISYPIQERLPLSVALMGAVVLSVCLHTLVVWKNRRIAGVGLRGPWRALAPILR